MQVVLDTNILCEAIAKYSIPHLAVVLAFPTKLHSITLDFEGAIFQEYNSNLRSYTLYQKWYRELQWRNLVSFASGHLSASRTQELSRRGLSQPEDQTLVALAIRTSRNLITEDSHFGKGPSINPKDPHAVRDYIRNKLNVALHDAQEALALLA